ncbi:MAG TPA: hypothetical protein VLJ58_20985 [Ramlibacter sp.]|nr:hypothetical protein [Ramlibacter sp.]
MNPRTALPTRLKRFLVGFACVVFGVQAWAGVDASIAESLLRKSGLWSQLADVASQVRSGTLAAVARGRTRPSEAEMERISRAIASAYAAHGLRSACVAALSRDLDPAHVAALLSWYDGPNGQAISRLEEGQSRQSAQTTLDQGAALLQGMPSSRRRVLEEAVLATRSAELMTEMSIGMALAAQLGAASASPHAAGPSLRELKDALEARRHDYMRSFTALSLAAFAATYASLSDADLEKYVDFLKSQAGQHYVAVTGRAFSAAMLNAAAHLARTAPGFRDKANT